jgi:hypothetical protein
MSDDGLCLDKDQIGFSNAAIFTHVLICDSQVVGLVCTCLK